MSRSTEKVWEFLKKTPNASVTFREIVEGTGLAPRTLRYGINELKKREVIGEKVNFKDMRGSKYFLKIPQKVDPCTFLDAGWGEVKCSIVHPDSEVCRREPPNKFKIGADCLMTGG